MASEEIWILSIFCLSELVLADPDTTIINETAAVKSRLWYVSSPFFLKEKVA